MSWPSALSLRLSVPTVSIVTSLWPASKSLSPVPASAGVPDVYLPVGIECSLSDVTGTQARLPPLVASPGLQPRPHTLLLLPTLPSSLLSLPSHHVSTRSAGANTCLQQVPFQQLFYPAETNQVPGPSYRAHLFWSQLPSAQRSSSESPVPSPFLQLTCPGRYSDLLFLLLSHCHTAI